MKFKKQLLSVLLSIVFIFGSFVPSISCYAVSLSDINTYFDVQGKFYQILKQETDISTTVEHQTSILNKMYDILENGGYSGSRSGDGLSNSGDITINTNGDVLLSTDLRNAIREATQYEIDNNMSIKYGYTFNSALYLSLFSTQTQYHAFLNLLNDNDGKLIHFGNYSSSPIYIFDGDFDFVFQSSSLSYYSVRPYSDWQTIPNSSWVKYTYDSTSESYVINGTGYPTQWYLRSDNSAPDYGGYGQLISLNTIQYIIYNSFNDMQLGSEGLQSYYVGNDFSTSTVNTTQTFTDSMLNSSISYGDISNYVNSYYVTNQTYPTTENVYNYINNYTGSGGGSGDDNGNGSDDDNNIWDFLDGIGEFIGNLISSLGNVLSGILSLLTDVIDMFIGENGLPNIIGQLIEYFLPFLPTEFLRLIELSILLALILGVVRLIRGH